jgi:hypothetical protein
MTLQKTISCGIIALLAACSAGYAQSPVTSAFTYQGELASAGTPATGSYDIRYRLYDAATGGTQIGSTLCSDNLAVANGRFAASLDFGAAFAGQQRFLEIEVRQDTGLDCSDDTDYTLLTPRQEIAATPNATFAQNAATAANAASLNGQSPSFYQNAANLSGTVADARLSNNVARLDTNQTFTGLLNFTNAGNTFAGSGAGLTNLSGSSITDGTLARSSLSDDVQSGVGTLVPDLSLAGSIATGANPQSVAVSGSFAFVVNQSSSTLQIFNISNPVAPTLAGGVVPGLTPVSVAVSGSFAYVVNRNSSTLQVFNISNRAAPTLAGSVVTGSNPLSVAVSGSFAYVVNEFSNTLQVFNISNPAAPTLAGSVATATSPISVAVSGSFAYVVNQFSNRLQVFNISNPAAPTLAGSVATGDSPRSVAVSGSFAYVVNFSSNTLQIFNISNPAAITLAGSVATGTFPNSVAVSGSAAYVVNGLSNTLQVFNAANRVGFGTTLASSSLLGVNGSGLTGVNATQLDGQPASFYTNASNITTGTLADARLSGNVALLNAGSVGFSGRVSAVTLQVPGNLAGSRSQGAYLEWNKDFSSGQSWLLNQRGQGAGGWVFGEVDTSGTVTTRMRIEANGNVTVVNSLAKGGGSFKIDHPLDPENKYLYHSFVESPDMMNIYNGNVTTDVDGYATITLPDYFEALNRDFRYQLTVIDESDEMDVFLWAKVVREVKNNQFTLRSSRGHLKVSWQVTGIRQDAWAEKNRIPGSVDKTPAEKGKYLHPEAFGKPVTQGVHFAPSANGQPVSK